jgi:hypothetical protein
MAPFVFLFLTRENRNYNQRNPFIKINTLQVVHAHLLL